MMLRLIVGLITLPWTILFGVVRLVLALCGLPRSIRARTTDTLVCPAGHVNALLGRWTCGCGASYLGHAFGPCVACRMPAGWVRCTTCGLAILSPWKND